MTLRDFFKYGFLGVLLQVVIVFFLGVMGFDTTATIYWPWIILGERVLPSGPGGHAMPLGAIVGLLVGVFVYSSVIGVLIFKFRQMRSSSFK